MTKPLNDRKYRVIEKIIKIEDESLLFALEMQLEQESEPTTVWDKVIKPVSKQISLTEMIHEQSYTPIKSDIFFTQAAQLEIQEPLIELLAELS